MTAQELDDKMEQVKQYAKSIGLDCELIYGVDGEEGCGHTPSEAVQCCVCYENDEVVPVTLALFATATMNIKCTTDADGDEHFVDEQGVEW